MTYLFTFPHSIWVTLIWNCKKIFCRSNFMKWLNNNCCNVQQESVSGTSLNWPWWLCLRSKLISNGVKSDPKNNLASFTKAQTKSLIHPIPILILKYWPSNSLQAKCPRFHCYWLSPWLRSYWHDQSQRKLSLKQIKLFQNKSCLTFLKIHQYLKTKNTFKIALFWQKLLTKLLF